jgi:anti-anti-sigma factor
VKNPPGTNPVQRGSQPERIGSLHYDFPTERWSCTPEACAILALEHGTSSVGTQRLLAALEPGERERLVTTIARAAHDGRAFGMLLQGLRASGRRTWLMLLGDPLRGRTGVVSAIYCQLIDVTERQNEFLTEFATAAIDEAVSSRTAIEQAKGALMLGYGIDADSAFAQLLWQSKQSDMKIREIAAGLMAALVGDPLASAHTRSHLDELLYGLPERLRPTNTEKLTSTMYKEGSGTLSVRIRRADAATVLEIIGDVDLATAPEFDQAVSTTLRRSHGPDPVIIDATGVDHLGSIGIKLLGRYDRRCAQAGIPLLLVAPPGSAAESVLIAALPGLKVHPTVTAALAAATRRT